MGNDEKTVDVLKKAIIALALLPGAGFLLSLLRPTKRKPRRQNDPTQKTPRP